MNFVVMLKLTQVQLKHYLTGVSQQSTKSDFEIKSRIWLVKKYFFHDICNAYSASIILWTTIRYQLHVLCFDVSRLATESTFVSCTYMYMCIHMYMQVIYVTINGTLTPHWHNYRISSIKRLLQMNAGSAYFYKARFVVMYIWRGEVS